MPPDPLVRIPDGLSHLRGEPFEPLARALFPGAYEVRVLHQFGEGFSGATPVAVEEYLKIQEGVILRGLRYVIKYGDTREIEIEQRNYQDFVERFLTPGTFAESRAMVALPGRGISGIKYHCVGGEGHIFTFAKIYKSRALAPVGSSPHVDASASYGDLAAILRSVFVHNLGPWYDQAQRSRTSEPALTMIDKVLEKKRELTEHMETLMAGLNAADANDARELLALGDPALERYSMTLPCGPSTTIRTVSPFAVLEKIKGSIDLLPCKAALVHGDLNANNVIVDGSGRPWLIDFAKTCYGHWLRDFAKCEAVLKIELVDPLRFRAMVEADQILMTEISSMQLRSLAFVNSGPLSPAEIKALTCVLQLRDVLSHLATFEPPRVFLFNYLLCLLYYTCPTVGYALEGARRLLALISSVNLSKELLRLG